VEIQMKKAIVLSVFGFVIIACGKKGGTTESVFTPESPEEASWHSYCSECHSLKRAMPNKHKAAEWPDVVERMRKKGQGNQFPIDQKALIVKYLQEKAKS
jgi:hypothetical protein